VSEGSFESKRLSIRRVAMLCGIPQRAVARAVATGSLPAVQIETETGRVRYYVSKADALKWFESLSMTNAPCEKSGAL
jgi:hypothetical protein